MSGLVEFLRARLDEDEAVARRAASYDDGASHDVQGPAGTWACLDESEWFGTSYRGGVIAPRIGNANAPELGAHITRHNPARVLAEVEAKRELIRVWEKLRTLNADGGYAMADGAASRAVQLLAAVYASHPDYREEWRP